MFIPCSFAEALTLASSLSDDEPKSACAYTCLSSACPRFELKGRANIPACCSTAVSSLKYTKHYSLFQDCTQKKTVTQSLGFCGSKDLLLSLVFLKDYKQVTNYINKAWKG